MGCPVLAVVVRVKYTATKMKIRRTSSSFLKLPTRGLGSRAAVTAETDGYGRYATRPAIRRVAVSEIAIVWVRLKREALRVADEIDCDQFGSGAQQ
jgi:hypothetical protein